MNLVRDGWHGGSGIQWLEQVEKEGHDEEQKRARREAIDMVALFAPYIWMLPVAIQDSGDDMEVPAGT